MELETAESNSKCCIEHVNSWCRLIREVQGGLVILIWRRNGEVTAKGGRHED